MTDQVLSYIDFGMKVFMLVFSIWVFFDRKSDKTKERIDALEKEMVTIKTRVEHLPNDKHIDDLYKEIKKVFEKISVIDSKLSGVESTVHSVQELTNRMDTFWRNHGAK